MCLLYQRLKKEAGTLRIYVIIKNMFSLKYVRDSMFLFLCLLVFIANQVTSAYKWVPSHYAIYYKIFSSTITILSSGFFIALLVYFFTVIIPERKADKLILDYILKRYYEMKEDLLLEISSIIGITRENPSANRKKLSHCILDARYFFKETIQGEENYRYYKLWNNLTVYLCVCECVCVSL